MFIFIVLFISCYYFFKILKFFSCSGMFRDVPECSGMFRHVPECSMFRVLSTAKSKDVFEITGRLLSEAVTAIKVSLV